jgi:hypothetical protein
VARLLSLSCFWYMHLSDLLVRLMSPVALFLQHQELPFASVYVCAVCSSVFVSESDYGALQQSLFVVCGVSNVFVASR